jgi:hypothetical protein
MIGKRGRVQAAEWQTSPPRKESNRFEELFEFWRQSTVKVQLASTMGVSETKLAGVEREPLPGPGRMSGEIAAVAGFTQHRMSLLGKVDADLIPSSRFQRHADVG